MTTQWQITERNQRVQNSLRNSPGSPNKDNTGNASLASRHARVMAAKAAFAGTDIAGEACLENVAGDDRRKSTVTFPWGLWRFMASVMLLILLLVAFSNGFSYHGFNREYVQQKLCEDGLWQQLEQQVQDVYASVRHTITD